MREATTRRAGVALGVAIALAVLAATAAGGAAAEAPADSASMRWTLTLEGTVSASRESRTRTVSPSGCTTELVQTSSESWRWNTRAPVAVAARRGARGQVELVRGQRRGVIRVPVLASLMATAAESSTTTGGSPDCKPSFGLSGLCPESRAQADLFVSVAWNARSARFEFGPPAPAPAMLRKRIGGCATAREDPASLFELPFETLAAPRPVAAPTLLAASGPFTREARDEARRSEPGGAREKRSSRVRVRLTPSG